MNSRRAAASSNRRRRRTTAKRLNYRDFPATVVDRHPVYRLDGPDLRDYLHRAARLAGAPGHFAICFTSDREIRGLNEMYRGIAKPTDVLSFPAEEKPRRGTYLGDIVISVDTAMDQILEFGHSLDEEIRVLALHGLLHLMGYDHENDNGRMRAVEERLRKQLGLDAGVISRATRRKSGIGAQQIRQIIRRASFRQMRRRYASETRDRLKPVLHRSSRTR